MRVTILPQSSTNVIQRRIRTIINSKVRTLVCGTVRGAEVTTPSNSHPMSKICYRVPAAAGR
eukprot:10530-Eustigmatos_ZCMA.PRE.1